MSGIPSHIAHRLVPESHYAFLSWSRDRFGLARCLFQYLEMSILGRQLARIPSGLSVRRLYIRPGTTDQSVYDEVLLSGEYAVDAESPSVIVDAGAHIGLASLFFSTRYPEATVIALEPEPANFQVLTRNVAHLPHVRPLNVALWNTESRLSMDGADRATWSHRVSEDRVGAVLGVTLPQVMERFGVDRIDILKLDIEGAEQEVMGASAEWIDKVGLLVVETHDRFRPGCCDILRDATEHTHQLVARRGDVVILKRLADGRLAGDRRAGSDVDAPLPPGRRR